MSEEITTNEPTQEELEVLEQTLALANGEVKEAEHPDGIEMTEWAFSNDKTNPAIRQLFHMLMNSAFVNKLGVMHAKVEGEDTIHTLIVGVEVTPEGIATWPLAKVLTEEEQGKYEAPDGNGGYLSAIK